MAGGGLGCRSRQRALLMSKVQRSGYVEGDGVRNGVRRRLRGAGAGVELEV